VETLVRYVQQHRNLNAGIFDQYLYNNVQLWADTLDPFVVHFRSLGIPFLALRFGPDLFSLFITIPSTAIATQILSNVLTETEPRDFDPCSDEAQETKAETAKEAESEAEQESELFSNMHEQRHASKCENYAACATANLTGYCCPTLNGAMLGCCEAVPSKVSPQRATAAFLGKRSASTVNVGPGPDSLR